jgi:hypothetical protein
MKSLAVVFVLGAAIAGAHGQYKAPSQYFRKDFPAPNKAGQQPGQAPQQQPQQPQAGQQQPQQPQQPQAAAQPRFKNIATNGQFYFITDTNRTYPWVKISGNVATNSKTGVKQTLHPEIPVQQ